MKKSLVFGVFLFVISTVCYAQKILTVEDAVSLAMSSNLTVTQGKMDLDLLKLKNKYSWNSVSPSFSLSGEVSGNKAGTKETFEDADPTLSWSASGGVSLRLASSLATTIKDAKLAYEAGQLSYENTKRSIELNVRKTFYSLLYFNENLELQKRNLETLKQTYESNLLKYNQGRLSELTLLTSQYNYESKIPSVTNLQANYDNSIDNFKITLGLDIDDEIELVGNLEELTSKDLNNKLLDVNIEELPAIKLLNKNIESSKNKLASTRFSAYGPTVSLSTQIRANGGIKPKTDERYNLSYSANVSIPLDGYLPWSNTALGVKSQKEQLEKQIQSMEQTKKSTEISIRNSYNAIKQAKTQLALYEKNVELMQKTYDMTKTAYNAGSSDFLTLQKAEDNLYQAKYNVQNQRYTIISSMLELENTLGIQFGTLVQENENGK